MMKSSSILKSLITNNKLIIFLGLLVSLLYSVVITATPLVSKYLIDNVLLSAEVRAIYIGIIIFFSICILQPITYYIKERIYALLAERVTCKFRKKMLKKFINMQLSDCEKIGYGAICTRIISDAQNLGGYVYFCFSYVVTNVTLSVLLIVTMLIENWVITVVILLMYLTYLFLNNAFTKKFISITKKGLKINEILQNNIKQVYDNYVDSKLYWNNSIVQGDINTIIDTTKDINLKSYRLNAQITSVSMAVAVLSLTLIYGLGALLIFEGYLTLGSVVALGLIFQNLMSALNFAINSSVQYNKVKASIVRISEYNSFPIECNSIDFIDESKGIFFKNVSFEFNSKKVLDKFNLDISDNGLYCLVGESGKGKSTIANLIVGLYSDYQGQIKILGQEQKTLNKALLRKNISYSTQQVHFFEKSIYDNLVCGHNIAMQKVVEVCKYFEIYERIMSMPEKFNTVITDELNLSGGEKRKLALCRAFLKESKIYILDEPENGLPFEVCKRFGEYYRLLSKEHIVIIISHRVDLYPANNKIVYV